MSFKAIDLQFAVHKNDEAGIRQNQLMQKPRQDETVLENQAAQTTEKDRHRSSKLEESVRTDIKDHGDQRQQFNKGKTKNKGKAVSASPEGSYQPDHPYKGHHIDLSL
ncbi:MULTISPECIES: hypothetical protein [unclassified Paenibacillus]|uniref:hypothetical protein n=1 Tax=unclassified Paenibacillus TaxID=185978 RepID=UPI00070F2EEA|nr:MULTISPECIES: hypothetical protein [unclassified Paenibacillus]KQX69164.1 hypothetical protein ASD40_01310 [Paenibacillus sp. Root444D2]KRE51710.1 hypothetical protein ASG85_00810 [Paenibacillus sp. Soil724D2]